MKGIITFFLLFNAFLITAQAQIPNGSFENWTTVGSYSIPNGWDNANSITDANSVYTCEKGITGAPHGSAFLKLTTKVAGTSTVAGLAACGTYDFANSQPKSGFPYTGRPQNLTGKWQYMANGTDTGRIAVYLTKWNTVSNTREIIGGFQYDLPGMVMSWASFSIPLTYFSGATPDTAIVGLTSSNKTKTAGSYLYVDSLNFAGSVAGVPVTTKYQVNMYPNPATNHLTLDFGHQVTDDVHIVVTDVLGKVTADAAYHAGMQAYTVNLDKTAPGIYFVKVQVGDDVQTLRLVIQ